MILFIFRCAGEAMNWCLRSANWAGDGDLFVGWQTWNSKHFTLPCLSFRINRTGGHYGSGANVADRVRDSGAVRDGSLSSGVVFLACTYRTDVDEYLCHAGHFPVAGGA